MKDLIVMLNMNNYQKINTGKISSNNTHGVNKMISVHANIKQLAYSQVSM